MLSVAFFSFVAARVLKTKNKLTKNSATNSASKGAAVTCRGAQNKLNDLVSHRFSLQAFQLARLLMFLYKFWIVHKSWAGAVVTYLPGLESSRGFRGHVCSWFRVKSGPWRGHVCSWFRVKSGPGLGGVAMVGPFFCRGWRHLCAGVRAILV